MIEFVQNNIHLLKPEHLKQFANKHHIPYTEEEIQIIYVFILDHYQELLMGNKTSIETIKHQLNPTLYKELISLYQKYKK